MGRRRRPSGEPPPLPRPIVATTRWYLVAVGLMCAFWFAMLMRPVAAVVTRIDLAVVHLAVHTRTGALTAVMRTVALLGTDMTIRVLAWSTIAVLVAVRRIRHLLVYLVLLFGSAVVATAVELGVGRMRPAGVTFLVAWDGYSLPSRPVAVFALVAIGGVHTLAPCGRWRTWSTYAAAVSVVALASARVYLGVDHPTDVLTALALGWALPVVVFRLVTPDEVFPVRYHGGRAAHLDIGGPRREAIGRALDHQLGLEVISVEPFGLARSAGSTPLRLHVRRPDGGEALLFGKLYALNHLRADRWYKAARTILYGQLEDEKPFSTVRRLVEYEDHLLRLMRDADLATPEPYGFVEITPEREYLVVMQMFEDAEEIGSAPVDDLVVDEALAIVRRLWDAGIAHRDIKPSNVLVRDSHVFLIDVAFATVRPTPWRQAVDLANMMLTLALSTTPEHVYHRALTFFAPEDIAEAFAASRSITIPTQLRARIRASGRDTVAEFRRLAPERRPVAIQLWSVRRIGLTLCTLLAVAIGLGVGFAYLQLVGLL